MKRKILSSLCIIVLLLGALFVPVAAADSTMITSAVINIEIKTDGSVDVTEEWNINPAPNDKGFVRQIDLYDAGGSNELSLLQKIGEIKDVTVSIDGMPVDENTYTAKKSDGGKSFDINISASSKKTDMKYTINYTMLGAVKKDGKNAVFAFRVIGKTFQLTANSVDVNITAPGEVTLPDDVNATTDEKTASFSSKRVYDTFDVKVFVDSDVFDSGSLGSYSAFSESLMSIGGVIRNAAPYLIFVLFAIIVVILLLCRERIRRNKLERNVTKVLIKDSLKDIDSLPEGKTPCEIYKMLVPYSASSPKSTSKKVPLLFALSVLECIEKGYIAYDGAEYIVGTPVSSVPEYTQSTLNFIKTFCTVKDNRYVIDDAFSQKIKNECMANYDRITNYLSTFYNMIPCTNAKFFKNEKNREFYENAYAVKIKCEKLKSKLSFSDYVKCVFGGEKVSNSKIFAMMFSSLSNSKLFKVKSNETADNISDAISEIYAVFVKSK